METPMGDDGEMTDLSASEWPTADDLQGGTPTRRNRRRALVVAAVVVIVLVATVVTDIPEHASHGSQVSGARSIVTEVEDDVAECSLAINEAFTVYRGVEHKTLTASERAE